LVLADTLTAPLAAQVNENLGFDEVDFEVKDDTVRQSVPPFKETIISLFLVGFDATLTLKGRNEYSLGRIARGQPILPDFDLTEYDAYNRGVSRLHAVIKAGGASITIMDMGSANGTRVNGQKLVSNVEYPLKNGDLIALGKLKIEFSANSE
jgi:hypothetical protein